MTLRFPGSRDQQNELSRLPDCATSTSGASLERRRKAINLCLDQHVRAPLNCVILRESEYDEWQALVESSTQGSVYANSVFLAALCQATGGTFRILAVRRADELVGGVALFEHPGGSGRRVSPRPLLYYNGVVLEEQKSKYPSQQTARLIEVTAALESALSGAGLDRVVLRNQPSFADARAFMVKGWDVRPGYTYVVSIADLGMAWNRMEQNLRRLVKRCTNEGLQFADDDDFDSFLRMHVATAERKGADQYLPAAAFKVLLGTLHAQGLCRLYHARLPSGESISAQLVLLGKHSVCHTVAAAADEKYLNMGATAFLRWKAFEALSALGYAANDLTDAALNPVSHFKSQLGGKLETWLVVERSLQPASWRRRVRAAISTRLSRWQAPD